MTNITIQGNTPGQIEPRAMTMSLNEMMKKVALEPEIKTVYSGIKENSIGIIVGPSKSCKTMYCENLGMAIAAGLRSYLGLPIKADNKVVLFLSLEEHYSLRTARNIRQAAKLTATLGEAWADNYIVATEEMPTYITTPGHWQLLTDVINKHAPGVVIIDSVGHLCQGIEDSSVAQAFAKNLRELSKKTNTTIICVHHTHKLFGRPLTMDNIAGSRVVAQEMDFMIGINRSIDGQRYIKDLAFRYTPNDKETVTKFTIDDDLWLNVVGEVSEWDMLKEPDGRRDTTNEDKITDCLLERTAADNPSTAANELETHLVASGVMSRGTLFSKLKKLTKEGKIIKSGSQYRLAA